VGGDGLVLFSLHEEKQAAARMMLQTFGCTCDGNTTGTLLLGLIHIKGEGEGILSKRLGLILQLCHLTLADPAQLKDKSTGRGRLAGVDMPADDNGDVPLSFRHGAIEIVGADC
jgi:hypothetical protein